MSGTKKKPNKQTNKKNPNLSKNIFNPMDKIQNMCLGLPYLYWERNLLVILNIHILHSNTRQTFIYS